MTDVTCSGKYLILPVNRHAQKRKLYFYVDGVLVQDLNVHLDPVHPEQDFYLNVERFAGLNLELRCEPEIDMAFRQSDVKQAGETLYKEKYRPGFHFSAKNGWLNDPNGLVYGNGKYYLFFQHNPVGNTWGNMHWGLAVSRDLLHWEEKEPVLYPDSLGTMFSGAALVDARNVAGLKENENDVILLFYTAAGNSSETSKNRPYTQCLAYSTDGGAAFRKYDRNPVVPLIEYRNRDPKVIYHPPTASYVMALYLAENRFALLKSANLLEWTRIQEISLNDDGECPDFYPLPVDDDPSRVKWVFTGCQDRYLIGSFDGSEFRPEMGTKRLHYGANSFASQSWSDIGPEDGRRIRIAWNNFEIPGMPFNQCMTFPCEMKLRTFSGEPFLCAYPIREIERLHRRVERSAAVSLHAGETYARTLNGDLYDIRISLRPAGGDRARFRLSLFGLDILGDGETNELRCLDYAAPMEKEGDSLDLRLLVDRTGVEIFIGGGRAFLSIGHLQDPGRNRLEIVSTEGDFVLQEAMIAELENIWQEAKP